MLNELYPQTRGEWIEAVYLALIAVPLSLFSVLGAYHWRYEPLVWLGVAALLVLLMLNRKTRHPIRLAFWSAFLLSIFYATAQAVMIETYLAHNPTLPVGDLSAYPLWQRRIFWVAKSPLIGIVFGGIVALVTRWAVRRRGVKHYAAQTRAGRRARKG